jgi:hypothetical protein
MMPSPRKPIGAISPPITYGNWSQFSHSPRASRQPKVMAADEIQIRRRQKTNLIAASRFLLSPASVIKLFAVLEIIPALLPPIAAFGRPKKG